MHPSLDHAQELKSPHLTYSTSTFDLTLAKVTIISERQLKNKLNRIESNRIEYKKKLENHHKPK